MSWNYRIGTKMMHPSNAKFPTWREFLIIECYYDASGEIANGYAEPNILSGWDSLDDLKGTIELLNKMEGPILDLDNFPNIWNPEK